MNIDRFLETIWRMMNLALLVAILGIGALFAYSVFFELPGFNFLPAGKATGFGRFMYALIACIALGLVIWRLRREKERWREIT